jgi:hypothetical protein
MFEADFLGRMQLPLDEVRQVERARVDTGLPQSAGAQGQQFEDELLLALRTHVAISYGLGELTTPLGKLVGPRAPPTLRASASASGAGSGNSTVRVLLLAVPAVQERVNPGRLTPAAYHEYVRARHGGKRVELDVKAMHPDDVVHLFSAAALELYAELGYDAVLLIFGPQSKSTDEALLLRLPDAGWLFVGIQAKDYGVRKLNETALAEERGKFDLLYEKLAPPLQAAATFAVVITSEKVRCKAQNGLKHDEVHLVGQDTNDLLFQRRFQRFFR